MMMSNRKKTFGLHGIYTNISALSGLNVQIYALGNCSCNNNSHRKLNIIIEEIPDQRQECLSCSSSNLGLGLIPQAAVAC